MYISSVNISQLKKYLIKFFLFYLFSAPTFAQSIETNAVLTDDLQLQIPQLEFRDKQGNVSTYWANLKADEQLNFSILDFGLINQSSPATSYLATIYPLSSISNNQAPSISDITHQDALLKFTSSIALACAVVYGTTTAFGQIAVDDNMNGGAHTSHQPLLANLLPEQTYYYQVQGSAADGKIYKGEIQQFTTAAKPETTSSRVNVASLSAGATVLSVSSNYAQAENNQTWGANSALDDNENTAWSSNGDGNNAFLEVAFAGQKNIQTVSVWTRNMSNGTAIISKFQLRTDDGSVFGPFELADFSQAYEFDVVANTATLKFEVLESSGGNTGLISFAVFE